LSPESAQAHQNLAAVLAEKGQLEEAMAHALAALRLNPRNGSIHCSFADVLSKAGKVEEAVKEYQRALELGWPPARFAQGERLLELGRPEEAAAQFFEVLRIQPNDPDAHYHLALALTRQGNVKQALPHYRQGMSSFAEAPEALNNLAWLLATHPDPEVRDGNEAVKLAERACKLTDYKRAVMVGTLAAAYAEAGRFAEAVATAEKARSLAKDANEKELEKRNLELQELYRTGKPYREK
jgi:Flp pilus assembly protein TadD